MTGYFVLLWLQKLVVSCGSGVENPQPEAGHQAILQE